MPHLDSVRQLDSHWLPSHAELADPHRLPMHQLHDKPWLLSCALAWWSIFSLQWDAPAKTSTQLASQLCASWTTHSGFPAGSGSLAMYQLYDPPLKSIQLCAHHMTHLGSPAVRQLDNETSEACRSIHDKDSLTGSCPAKIVQCCVCLDSILNASCCHLKIHRIWQPR